MYAQFIIRDLRASLDCCKTKKATLVFAIQLVPCMHVFTRTTQTRFVIKFSVDFNKHKMQTNLEWEVYLPPTQFSVFLTQISLI